MTTKPTFQRMPLGYGPMPGPRQTSLGLRVPGWSEVRSTTATIVFKTSKSHLSTFLPHTCFQICTLRLQNDDAYASISITHLENLPWLAGRGYSHCGFYIHDVVCKSAQETVRGKYLSVLFENRADPITSGREELGYAKVFASLDHLHKEDRFFLEISWEGTAFGTMAINGLQDMSASSESPADSYLPPEGLLHFKYIPRTGNRGDCDVQYPTFSPTIADGTSTREVFTAKSANFSFQDCGFQKLPTLHHIAARLAEIEPKEIVDARMVVALGAGDLSSQRALAL
jgi:acetoacetate decarboxylase